VGLLLSEEERERLVREDEPYRARSRALHLLAVRDRSRREVETRLRELGFGQEAIADTTAWLEGLGYLDDERFAQRYAAEKLRAGWGPRRVSAELGRKGVERGLVHEALEGEGDNAQAALEGSEALMVLVRRRFGAQFATDANAAERRLTGYLARRGYDWETIARFSRELRAEAGGEVTLP
jgi:regulatory protein